VFLFVSPSLLARRYIEKTCPDSITVSNKEKKAITVTLFVLCTLFKFKGSAKDRTYDMAKKINVSRKVFTEMVEKLWGEKMPNLSLIENIQNGSVGFKDETLNTYGWADAKKSDVGLLAFFATRSPEQRKVLQAENKQWRRSLNKETGEMELLTRNTVNGRQLVEWEDPDTGVMQTLTKSTASKRQLVEWQDTVTGVTYMVSKSTAYWRQLVEWKDPVTGVTYMVSRGTAYQRQLVESGFFFCKSSWCNTRGYPKYEGYCAPCFVHDPLNKGKPAMRNYKTKESDVVDRVKQAFKDCDWVADKTVQGGCSRRRPDLLLHMGTHVIIVEIDENKHNAYECSCENRRMMELSRDVNHTKIVFIRFNPDAYEDVKTSKKVKSCWTIDERTQVLHVSAANRQQWELRVEKLKQQIQLWIKNVPTKTVEVIQLFY